jgi:hypothetical protein
VTKYHDIEKVLFKDDAMILTVDGKEYSLVFEGHFAKTCQSLAGRESSLRNIAIGIWHPLPAHR